MPTMHGPLLEVFERLPAAGEPHDVHLGIRTDVVDAAHRARALASIPPREGPALAR